MPAVVVEESSPMWRVLAFVLALAPSLVAVWIASSLAAYAAFSPAVVASAGVILWPLLPLAWHIGARRRRARAASSGAPPPRARVSPVVDFTARSFVTGVVFVAFLLAWFPERTFLALSERGAWMLDGREGALADGGRDLLHEAAKSALWLHRVSRDDPYRAWHDDTPLVDPGRAAVTTASLDPSVRDGAQDGAGASSPSALDAGVDDDDDGEQAAPAPLPRRQICAVVDDGRSVCVDVIERPSAPDGDAVVATKPGARGGDAPPRPDDARRPVVDERSRALWPSEPKLHEALTFMRTSDEESLEEVASFIAARTRPGADRIRALHDWVADRIAYDAEAYQSKQIPPQDPDRVFSSRMAVCAGYARLLSKLGALAGEEIVYLSGTAKGFGGIERHAWNAARLDDGYALIDVTWDAGGIGPDGAFMKNYGTSYLFAPPAFFVANHLPDDPRWQLLDEPVDEAAFVRMRVTSAVAFVEGLSIRSPDEAVVDVGDSLTVLVENPRRRPLMASSCIEGRCTRCDRSSDMDAFSCALGVRGRHRVNVFVNVDDDDVQRFTYAMGLVANRR